MEHKTLQENKQTFAVKALFTNVVSTPLTILLTETKKKHHSTCDGFMMMRLKSYIYVIKI